MKKQILSFILIFIAAVVVVGRNIKTVVRKEGKEWKVLFHSSNPKLWNTEYKSKNEFSELLKTAPETTKYLKLRLISQNKYVILPITKNDLNKQIKIDDYLWCGQKKSYKDKKGSAVLLGIADKNVPVTYKKRTYPILTYNRGKGLKGYAGWGFSRAPTSFCHGGQRFSWASKEIKEEVFEISVKSKKLTKEEKKKCLIKGEKLKKTVSKMQAIVYMEKLEKRKESEAKAKEIAELGKEILFLGRSIKNSQSRVKNAHFSIIKMVRSDAKSWSYRKGKRMGRKYKMSKLPQKYDRKAIRLNYISKEQKIAKIKKGFLKEVAKKEKKMKALVAKLKKLQQ